MENEYMIRYGFGWPWKKYWIVFSEKSLLLFNTRRENPIEIFYKDINHVFKQPLSLDKIEIYCTTDILSNYQAEKVSWFPPRPVFTPKVYIFSIHSLKRDEIIRTFSKFGVKTSIDPLSYKTYLEEVNNKWWEKNPS